MISSEVLAMIVVIVLVQEVIWYTVGYFYTEWKMKKYNKEQDRLLLIRLKAMDKEWRPRV